jgi:hypothetical protein
MITNCAIYAMLADMYLWRGSLHEGRHGKKGVDIVNGEEISHNVDDDYNKAVEYADLSLQYLANQNAAGAEPQTYRQLSNVCHNLARECYHVDGLYIQVDWVEEFKKFAWDSIKWYDIKNIFLYIVNNGYN